MAEDYIDELDETLDDMEPVRTVHPNYTNISEL